MITARLQTNIRGSKIDEAATRVKRRVLYRFGGLVRSRARDAIQEQEITSRPGRPPHSHTGRLRRGILFAVNLAAGTVVIGPRAYASGKHRGGLRALEQGGPAVLRGRRVRFRARPFMLPAFRQGLAMLPLLLRPKK